MPVHRRGFSLVGLLVALGCVLVLSVILLNSLNVALTGAGNAVPNSAASLEDKFTLANIHQALVVAAQEYDGGLPVPSEVASGERSLDTTASLYSLFVMHNRVSADALMSANEFSPFVRAALEYDYSMYDPRRNIHWDPSFKADLAVESNTSFAHMPLFGDRYETHWLEASLDSTMPLFGNRGPEYGRPDPTSYTNGRNGLWAGHLVFGDGHVEFTDQFTLAARTVSLGDQRVPDNVFAFDDGPEADDAMITFTREMAEHGPVVQHD